MLSEFTKSHRNCLPVLKDGLKCYDIVYSRDLAELQPALDQAGLSGKKALIVTDSNVKPLYADAVASSLTIKPAVYCIPAGEEHKTLDEVRSILRYLIENKYDRSCFLIALGGGVVGDMTGFAASIFLRGVDFVQIPTTLLSQADSSIGGKTGVDFEGFKNMVGAFKMPRLVYANVNFLATLNNREYAGGFAEIMKHGLILDRNYYDWLMANKDLINARDPETMTTMLYRSNEIKKYVVEIDPYEKGLRMLLNFGHTIGHAVEKYRNFTLTHGECVALGCAAAAFLSRKRGYISEEDYHIVCDGFKPFGLHMTASDLNANEIIRLMLSDKKAAAGKVKFILLHHIGDAFVSLDVTNEEAEAAIESIME